MKGKENNKERVIKYINFIITVIEKKTNKEIYLFMFILLI